MYKNDMFSYIRKRDRMDEKRQKRLQSKLQKANAMHRREEAERLASWNKKFGFAQRMRVEVNT